MAPTPRPAGITCLALFFVFGATMSALTAFLLSFPGSLLDPVWRLNPRAHSDLSSLGTLAIALMLAVSLACSLAAAGLWRLTRWGYAISLFLLAANFTGDLINATIGRDWRSLIGLPIAALIAGYLIRKRHLFPHSLATPPNDKGQPKLPS